MPLYSWFCRASAQSAGAGKYPNCLLCRWVGPPSHSPGYDIKQSNGEAQVKLALWGMWSTFSLLSLPGPFWPGVVAPDRILSIGQIEPFDI